MSYPAPPGQVYPPPPLVPQSSDGVRVLRWVLAALLAIGWVADGLHTPAQLLPGVTLHWSGVASLATLILLIVGPQPRWATKWAWFWLLGVGPMSVVFLLAEPVPVWQTSPAYARPQRLTGGWAFLLAIVGGLLLNALASLVVTPWLDLVRAGYAGWWLP
ncbi:hypothetical protein Q6348_02430 [Isoptericola sp. b441]|uniref:Uncharacterized protein n=1 Tax=Actinotalea lenta TaxID=3064654 RepID=A0ABT9D5I4_9CELL|nr:MULTISPECIES: hypothetical protein [unclassified Isoptericola]MDO8106049.1 hypothetical protein [Isoptericola sp. b441]MDO8122232.1 hypothetical protein [Isoptericola sp. b490]